MTARFSGEPRSGWGRTQCRDVDRNRCFNCISAINGAEEKPGGWQVDGGSPHFRGQFTGLRGMTPLSSVRRPLEESPSETEAACSGGRAAAPPPAFLPACALAGPTPRCSHVLFAGDRLTRTRPPTAVRETLEVSRHSDAVSRGAFY